MQFTSNGSKYILLDFQENSLFVHETFSFWYRFNTSSADDPLYKSYSLEFKLIVALKCRSKDLVFNQI